MSGGIRRGISAAYLLLSGTALACGSGPARSADDVAAEVTPGSSPDAPVLRCGPEDSYAYVASEFRCPDGTNPFDGDLRQAARARSGSRRADNGHFIDSYEVPCAGGTVTVYVDLYGCDEQPPPSEELPAVAQELLEQFRAGDLETVVERCAEARASGPRQRSAEYLVCSMILPVTLLALGAGTGEAEVASICSAMPPVSDKSDARVAYLGLVFAAFDLHVASAESRLSEDEVNTAKGRFGTICDVPHQAVPRVDLSDLF